VLRELIEKLREKEEFSFEDIDIGHEGIIDTLRCTLEDLYGVNSVSVDHGMIILNTEGCEVTLYYRVPFSEKISITARYKDMEISNVIYMMHMVDDIGSILAEIRVMIQKVKAKQHD